MHDPFPQNVQKILVANAEKLLESGETFQEVLLEANAGGAQKMFISTNPNKVIGDKTLVVNGETIYVGLFYI